MKSKRLEQKVIEHTIRNFSNIESSSFPYSPNYKLPNFNQYYSISTKFHDRNTTYASWWRYLETIYCFENELIGKNLDIGTGWGTVYFILKELGFESHAQDLKNLTGIDDSFFTVSDLNENKQLPFDDASFDSVTMIEVVEHIDDPVHLIREVSRIIRNEGIFVLSTPNVLSVRSRLDFLLRSIFPKFKWFKSGKHRYDPESGLGGHVSSITYHQFCWILERNGFEVDKIVTNIFDYPTFFIKRWFLFALSSLINVITSPKNPILEWGHTLIIKARKSN